MVGNLYGTRGAERVSDIVIEEAIESLKENGTPRKYIPIIRGFLTKARVLGLPITLFNPTIITIGGFTKFAIIGGDAPRLHYQCPDRSWGAELAIAQTQHLQLTGKKMIVRWGSTSVTLAYYAGETWSVKKDDDE